MKKLLIVLGCLLAAVGTLRAQPVTVNTLLGQDDYLPGENLPVRVRISNFSGQTLELGRNDEWLSLTVEDGKHFPIRPFAPIPVRGPFNLETSTIGTKEVVLSSCYDLSRPGRYYLSAKVTVPQWGQVFSAKTVSFDVIKGSDLWDREFGMPLSGTGPQGVPEIRRYALVETVHTKAPTLYFRLTDVRGTKVFAVYPLGTMVSFTKLEPQMDKFSNLHVLFQTGGRIFSHCLINPDGVLLVRETFEVTDTRPVLRGESDGRMTVVGGIRRPSSTDLPPPFITSSAADAKLVKP